MKYLLFKNRFEYLNINKLYKILINKNKVQLIRSIDIYITYIYYLLLLEAQNVKQQINKINKG